MPAPRRAVIVGLGLIGGSLGMVARSRGWQVSFIDPAVAESDARARGAADRRIEVLEPTDLVILATPVDAAMRYVESIPADQPATSVCSVLAPLAAAGERRGLRLVAGHPLAGSEHRSLSAAKANLFNGCRWFVAGKPEPIVSDLIAAAGAIADEVDAEEHDRAMALTSHLPQVLSTALAAAIEAAGIDVARFGGSGLRTFLRLAASDATVWEPIVEVNRSNLSAGLQETVRLAEEIVGGNRPHIFRLAQRIAGELAKSGEPR
jgi:prephenate dehydrogenase